MQGKATSETWLQVFSAAFGVWRRKHLTLNHQMWAASSASITRYQTIQSRAGQCCSTLLPVAAICCNVASVLRGPHTITLLACFCRCRLWISSCIGTGVFLLFCLLQRASSLYQYRLVGVMMEMGFFTLARGRGTQTHTAQTLCNETREARNASCGQSGMQMGGA